ncbi:hypothetical protein I7I53_04255 [Histoplasma capsulatum var. duboisii H88]|uniref:Uncharacterized protein n=1 Tax=Ajellomyces capsulatus (strain H88) TaxID=544711 RepID=A0A8A1LW08_AJEC8|nr:hypothetical protein I7I53_04255 [Histoplasma capsulatum var. duboisii H88]
MLLPSPARCWTTGEREPCAHGIMEVVALEQQLAGSRCTEGRRIPFGSFRLSALRISRAVISFVTISQGSFIPEQPLRLRANPFVN